MRRYAPLLLTLAAIWGSSYLFIKVALDEVEPAPMMATRLLVAGLVLFGYLVWRLGLRQGTSELRAAWRSCLVLGIVNAALPFWLLASGEKYIDSGVAAIAQATVPIFVLLLGLRLLPYERVSGARIAGIVLGLLGVSVLTGLNPSGGVWGVIGTLAVVLSSVAYATGAVFGQLRVKDVKGPVLATGSMLGGGVLLLPLALVQLPDAAPGWKAAGSIAALTRLGTAFAQLLLYRMLALHGSARSSLVAYLMPGFALVYGAVLLDEPITASAVGGLALVLAGVAVGSGAVRLPRRAALSVTP